MDEPPISYDESLYPGMSQRQVECLGDRTVKDAHESTGIKIRFNLEWTGRTKHRDWNDGEPMMVTLLIGEG